MRGLVAIAVDSVCHSQRPAGVITVIRPRQTASCCLPEKLQPSVRDVAHRGAESRGSGLLARTGPEKASPAREPTTAPGAAVRRGPPGCPETRVCLRPVRLDSPERRHALPRVDGRERGKLVPGRVGASVPQASGPTVGERPASPAGGRGLCQPEPAHQRASRLSPRRNHA